MVPMDPLSLLIAHNVQRRALEGATTTGPEPRRPRKPGHPVRT